MIVEVYGAYVAGSFCAVINIPNRQEMHMERKQRARLESAVLRHVRAACFPPPAGETITVQWHWMRPVAARTHEARP